MNTDQVDQVVALVFGDTEDAVLAVDHVFAVLAATYGAAWTRSLGDSPLSDIKTAWAYQLSQFTHSKTAKRSILWALQNLPDSVPDAMRFRNVCRLAPVAQPLALPKPKADPKRIADEIAKLAPLRQRTEEHSRIDHKDWAKRLQARDAAGEPMNMNQRRCYKIALGINESSALITKEAFLDAMGAA